jgi:hypothetical protein
MAKKNSIPRPEQLLEVLGNAESTSELTPETRLELFRLAKALAAPPETAGHFTINENFEQVQDFRGRLTGPISELPVSLRASILAAIPDAACIRLHEGSPRICSSDDFDRGSLEDWRRKL